MTTKKWLQAGIAAALLVSGAVIARAAYADSTCSLVCPNGQSVNQLWGGSAIPWGTTLKQQIPPCGNCFGSMWTTFSSSGSTMTLTINQGSGLAGDCIQAYAMDARFIRVGILANPNDGTSVSESVPGTPTYLFPQGYVCQNQQ